MHAATPDVQAVNLYDGGSLRVDTLPGGFAELCFDRQGGSVNKFDAQTVAELSEATQVLRATPGLRGVLVTSNKGVFIAGADIAEFRVTFALPDLELMDYLRRSNAVFERFEALEFPSVVAINGFALGGGLEFALAASYRVMARSAQVGLPEVGLGLLPGFGGTVRLPRVAGIARALEWVAGGKPHDAQAALEASVADRICEPDALRAEALALLEQAAASGEWRARRQHKLDPMEVSQVEADAAAQQAMERFARHTPRQQPAAHDGIALLARAARLDAAGAQLAESEAFARLARSQAAASLTRIFLSDQAVRKLGRQHGKGARVPALAAVLGAGIMGGGIAWASAAKGMPVRLKDIAQGALDVAAGEIRRLASRQVEAGRLDAAQAARVSDAVTPQLDDAGFGDIDFFVEAVVENLAVKHAVLARVESLAPAGAVIATNTSSLRVTDIASPLARPGNVVGMHFFNPVPAMPLVEIVRGEKTGAEAIARAAAYASAMGKIPLVVADCPGFLVNRIFTAYVRAFLQLLADGADFVKVDAAMRDCGWPMGPAQLEDVIGLDTGLHVNETISAGYAGRMPPLAHDALRALAGAGRLGQKNGLGFYRWTPGQSGRTRPMPDPQAHALVAALQPGGPREFEPAEIVDRLMLPLVIEAARALEEGVVPSAAEVDMAMLLGLGFPRHLGGPLAYADWHGLSAICATADRHAHLGEAWRPTSAMRAMAQKGARFHTGA
jgi:3-hydroxyacyl-CoA dehydrogenase / enoyl-CoA hydratase / 3-hydroxybutyryl-CoA epimerase / enoyl-CoA isomerase